MKGSIIVNGYLYTPNAKWQAEKLKEEMERLDVKVEIIGSNSIPALVEGDSFKPYLKDSDFVVYFDKDKHIANSLELQGKKLFNSAKSIELCDDKFLTYVSLIGSGIEMPKTVSAPLCYTDFKDEKFIDLIVKELGLPVVVKECYGSMGQQVYLAETVEELTALNQKLLRISHLYQKFIEKSRGRDMRVIVIGGKAVASMIRKSETDFRSNIELGGIGEACALPEAFRDTAEKAACLLGLDYCGVDILFDGDKPLLCEVNSNAYFKKISEVCNVNIARVYAEHILKKI